MPSIRLRGTRALPVLALAAAAGLLPSPARGQDTTGVRLGLVYQTEYQPGFVVLPFTGAGGTEGAAGTLRQLVRRDLDYSDRFELKEATGVRPGDPVNVALWKERGADWVLAGEVSPRPGGVSLKLTLHDAVYGQVKGEQTFALPATGDAGFRMAAHAASDAVVRWATGQPGFAASRIAFTLGGRGSKEIYVVDSDGEGVRALTSDGSIALSPAWSADGGKLAYSSYKGGTMVLYERDLATGRERVVSGRTGLNMTPAYSSGGVLAFATTVGSETEVVTWDATRGLRQQTRGGRSASFSPTWAPDGSRFAFVSDRLGEPAIYVMSPGGDATLVSEYVYGRRGYAASPDWSPRGNEIAFHSRVGGSFQIVMANANGSGQRLLTNSGRNEDPSWAPDGRHLVFASTDREGGGLFVLDTVTGRVRKLVGGQAGLPDWSPLLAGGR
jgi:TolB protein